jgi:hypothetical protein
MLGLANQLKKPEAGASIKSNGIIILVGVRL